MNQPRPRRGCFVTGTDTEVGKTHISTALLYWCSQQHWRSAGYKPIAAGTDLIDGQWVNADVAALRAASSLRLSEAEVGPQQYSAACAPHIAAALEQRTIDRAGSVRAAMALADRAEVLVVEGVGGFCVPLGPDWDSADLARDLQLPLLLVVGLRLGCINHALLTAEAISARGLNLAGWVGNSVAQDMLWRDETVTALRQQLMQRHAVPCLGVVPWLAEPSAANVAKYLEVSGLNRLFAPQTVQPPAVA